MLIYVELFSKCRVWSGLSSGIEIMQKVCGSCGTPPVMPKTDQLPLLYKNICDGCCQLKPEQRMTIKAVFKSDKICITLFSHITFPLLVFFYFQLLLYMIILMKVFA